MGKIFVVGIGPGSIDLISPRALKSIEESEVIVGYNTYIKLIANLIDGKKIIGTGMMGEIERCRLALDESRSQTVSIISSGDSGIYGMAGLILEMLLKIPAEDRPEFEIIPGISSANSAAAILGAPLMNDFATISLSDLLTPWEVIEKRIESAAQGDFVIALYNPKSHKRIEQIEIAQKILLKYRDPKTPVGIVTDASRIGESKILTTLDKFTFENISMTSIVIIGNSRTFIRDGIMITPRGYEI
ncbi:MAG: precorrin-3B C(17)-methyltransferase [Selenomonadaceae bacterium]|nr:precorrin-3B C(17)-methyltransferase [Selenomonadaceae bacterium]